MNPRLALLEAYVDAVRALATMKGVTHFRAACCFFNRTPERAALLVDTLGAGLTTDTATDTYRVAIDLILDVLKKEAE